MGAIPTAPVFLNNYLGGRGEVVNASDCDSDIRGFDTPRPPHISKRINTHYYIVSDYNMAVVAKWLTHRIVIPTFGGSIPLVRPISGV